jgi:hypothetical protein
MKAKLSVILPALLVLAAPAAAARAPAIAPAAALDQNEGLAGTAAYDRGLYTAYCPHPLRARTLRHPPTAPSEDEGLEAEGPEVELPESDSEEPPLAGAEDEWSDAASEAPASEAPPPPTPERRAMATAASTSEAGWPAKQCLKMDKGPAGKRHMLVGLNGVHNWLLGGYGSDTIIGGDHGDVIWGDYHPSGERPQTTIIRAGNGRNVIYADDTRNFVWTGTNPRTVVHAHVSGISGVIHCQSAGVVVYLSTVSQRHFRLDGCQHVSHYSVGY